MVPLGAYTFSGMQILSIDLPSSTSTKSLSSPLFSSGRRLSSSQLASIFSDHTYVLKSHGGVPEDDASWSNGCNESSAGVDDDEAFSSGMPDLHNIAESGDVDFLNGLDDLDFDLEPCDDVEMADSMQDFIDSALEDSGCSFLRSTGDSTQQPHQNVEDISKEEFVSSLCLRSTQIEDSNPRSSTSEKVPDSPWLIRSADEDVQLLDVVPTKICSCMISQTFPQAVYSMAQADQQSCVRTSPSTLVTGSMDNSCTNCLQNRLTTSTRVMSPLFIDTSFNEFSQSLQSSSADSVDMSIFAQDAADNDTTDVTTWLTESQQSDNFYDKTQNGKRENTVFAMPENSSSSLDLESFVDLDDYLDENLPQHTTPECPCEYSQLNLASEDDRRMSPLRLSFLQEDQDHKQCSNFGFYPHLKMCQSISPDSRTSESSNFSPCSSPAWSVTDSSQLSPVGSAHLSGSRALDNIAEDFSLKGQLALLKLFSEENAESLLLAESSVPTIRFV